MTRSAKIEFDWADGHHVFRLAIGDLEELQEKTGVGPLVLLNRLFDGSWRIADIREAIRLGLIGGGTKPEPALNLVRRYVDERPDWLNNATLARIIVAAAVSGVEDEPVKKKDPPAAP